MATTSGEETKNAKFKALAEARLERAVRAIKILAPLADRKRYEYTDEQAKYIIKTLKESVRNVENAFQGKIEKEISLP
jgi:uncharacterized protein YPO0396